MKRYLLAGLIAGLAVLPVFGGIDQIFDAIARKHEPSLNQEVVYWRSGTYNLNTLKNGKTPLMLAAELDWLRGVEILLDLRTDPNTKGANGETALHLAARSNQDTEIIKRLVDNRAVVNAADDMGNTVLMYAAKNKIPATLRYLMNRPEISYDQINNDKETALMIAIKEKNDSAVSALLEKSQNFSQVNKDGKNAFMLACESNKIAMVRAFLNLGKVDLYEDLPGEGSRPAGPVLLWAIDTGKSTAILTELISAYNDPIDELVDRSGRDAWWYADRRNNKAAKRLLDETRLAQERAANTQRR